MTGTPTLVARFAYSIMLGAALVGGSFSATRAADLISEQDAHAIGVTAYTYFYSLVTMDVTRKQLTNVAKPEGFHGADEYVCQRCRIPDGRHEGCRPAQFRHAVFQRVARSDPGADDRFGTRHQGALLPSTDAGYVDRRVRVSGLAHHRNTGRRLAVVPPGWTARSRRV